jgi:hypothetical protein
MKIVNNDEDRGVAIKDWPRRKAKRFRKRRSVSKSSWEIAAPSLDTSLFSGIGK